MHRQIASVALAATIAPAALADDIFYVGPLLGSWSSPANWSGGLVPGSGDTAFVDGSDTNPTSVVASGFNTVGALDIGADDLVEIPTGAQFLIEMALHNEGQLVVSPSGSSRFLRATDMPVTITGGGTIELSIGARMDRSQVGGAWINESNLLRGAGNIGANSTPFTNRATVRADVPGSVLALDPPAGLDAFVNEGLLESVGGGELVLSAGEYRNVGATITAGAGSTTRLSGVVVRGGTLQSIDDGFLEIFGVTTLDTSTEPVVLDGDVTVRNGGQVRSTGEIRVLDELRLASTGASTFLRAFDAPLTFTGGGTISLANAAVMDRVSAGGTLRTTDVVVRGFGRIGANSTVFTNESLVIADVSGAALILDPPVDPFVNIGGYRAENESILSLNPGTFVNLGSTMEAIDRSLIDVNGVTIDGGRLRTVTGGVVEFFGVNFLLGDTEPVVLDGPNFRVLNAGQIRAVGTLEILDTLRVASTGTSTWLRAPDTPVTLTGGGTVRLEGLSRVDRTAVGGEWIFEDILVAGEGNLGGNTTKITNRNIIRADVDGGTLIIDPPTGNDLFVNEGRIEVVGDAMLSLNPGTYANIGAVIEASGTSEIAAASTDIRGGEIAALDDSFVRYAGVADFFGDVEPVRLTGRHVTAPASQFRVDTALQNDGTIEIDSAGSTTFVRALGGPAQFIGSGEIVVSGGNVIFDRTSTNGEFINESNLIRGSGRFGQNTTPITNRGTMRADDPVDAMIIDPPSTGPGFINEGTLDVAAGGPGLIASPGAFENRGLLWVQDEATMSRTDDLMQTGGEIAIDGLLTLDASSAVAASGGVVSGSGTIDGDVQLGNATIDPGNAAGVATLEVLGLVDMSFDTTTRIQIAGSADGQGDLIDADEVILNGRLEVDFVDGFTPSIGDVFTIIRADAPGISGTFVEVACQTYIVQYLETEIRVEVVAEVQVEDLNCSGTVEFNDLLALLGAWGPCDGCQADFDGDGMVAFGDLLQLLTAWD